MISGLEGLPGPEYFPFASISNYLSTSSSQGALPLPMQRPGTIWSRVACLVSRPQRSAGSGASSVPSDKAMVDSASPTALQYAHTNSS